MGLVRYCVIAIGIVLAALFATPVSAQIAVPSDGSDGSLIYPGGGSHTDLYINLALAQTGSWSDPVAPENAGNGIYDPAVWAVVFKYDTVSIGDRKQLNFLPHPSGAPVVWLVQNDVTIVGNVLLDGSGVEAGPGGFRGGIRAGGFGPGGAGTTLSNNIASGGSYGSLGAAAEPGPTYGNARVFPLIGGSGGASFPPFEYRGGCGGGAILIAAGGEIRLDGLIRSSGGTAPTNNSGRAGGGSGGAIRLVADSVSGLGLLRAVGGNPGGFNAGGDGRIRIESNVLTLIDTGVPEASLGPVDDPPLIFPDPNTPVIRSIRLGGRDLPVDPLAQAYIPELYYPAAGDYELEIEAYNVPVDAEIEVRITPSNENIRTVTATFVSGNIATSLWSANVTLTDGKSQIQARAVLPIIAP